MEDIPVTLARSKTMEPNLILFIDVDPKAILFIRMERAIRAESIFSSSLEFTIQTPFHIFKHLLDVGSGFDVLIGCHWFYRDVV